MSYRVPTLENAKVERERRDLRVRLQQIDEASSDVEVLSLVDEALEGGLPELALRCLDRHGDTTDDLRLTWARCRALWDAGRRDDVRTLAASTRAAAAGGSVEARRIQVRDAWIDVLAGRPVPALDAIRRAVNRQQGPVPLLADLAHIDGYRSLVCDADLSSALASATLAAELYATTREISSEVKARVLLARTQAIAGRLQSSVHDARRAVERARGAADPRLVVQGLNALGIALFRRGEWEESERALVRSEEIALTFDEQRWRVAALLHLARLQLVRGEVERARETLDRLEPRVLAEHAAPMRAIAQEYRGMVQMAEGNPERALETFDRAISEIDAAGVVSYERAELQLRRTEALLALDRLSDAWSVGQAALGSIERTGQWLEQGHLLRVLALVAATSGRPREAGELRDRAERVLRRTGDRYELARCLSDRGRDAVSESARRREALAEAAHLFRVLDLPDEAVRCTEEEDVLDSHDRHDGAVDDTAASFGPGLIVASKPMRALLGELVTAASSDGPVLLQGETGTGKEVLARALHDRSARAQDSFVPVNCAAIPESLFEREFFGHARGSFTGAERDAPGLVEAADGGTLFLDEIGEMPMAMQPKLLRLLQEGTFRRVGEVAERSVDLRIVAATNRGLFERAQQGAFREDLYYRLSWFELAIPPLRERTEDVVALAQSFLAREGRKAGRVFWMDRGAWRALRRYGWPGNVRQLESAVSSSCARAGADGRITVDALPTVLRGARAEGRLHAPDVDLSRALDRFERELILDALRRAEGQRTKAARLLGIGRNTLYEKMKRLGIRPEAPGRAA